MDEATSALDNETEAAVMRAIRGLRKDRTFIIIAHRLSTVEECDRRYEIEGGKIKNLAASQDLNHRWNG